MDNRSISIKSDSQEHLKLGVDIAFTQIDNGVVLGFHVEKEFIAFFVKVGDGVTPFPCPINKSVVLGIINCWLSENEPTTPAPDVDGDCKPGFEFVTGPVNLVTGRLIKVRPIWAIYHK